MTEYRIDSIHTVTDPAERRRRLSHIYALLNAIAERKAAAHRESLGSETLSVAGDAPSAAPNAHDKDSTT